MKDIIYGKNIEDMVEKIKLAIAIVAKLRGPNGCPWDREQNHLSLRQYLIEEAYEVLEILDRYQPQSQFQKEDQRQFQEELGDLLLQILLHSEICSERGDFNFGDVCEALAKKLVSRHPHVFSDAKASTSEEVLQNWEKLKKKEGKKNLFDGLPTHLPSLQRAARIGEKAHRVGFDWKDWQGAWKKVNEEILELQVALDRKESSAIEHELGDLFFSLCHLARHLNLQPEDVHRKAIRRFESRFQVMEKILLRMQTDLENASEEQLDHAWEEAKRSSDI